LPYSAFDNHPKSQEFADAVAGVDALPRSRAALEDTRIDTLFRVSRMGHFAAPVSAGLLVALLWGVVLAQVLLVWLAVVVLVRIGRYALHRAYLRRAPGADAARWERRFALGAFASGACWTYPVLGLFMLISPVQQMALIFIVGGTVLGGTALYAASRLAFLSFASMPLLALAAILGIQPDLVCVLLAAAVLLSGAAMLRMHRDLHRNVIGSISARLDTDTLLGRLRESELRLREAIEHYPGGFALWSREGRLVLCNGFFAQLYGDGKSADQLVGLAPEALASRAAGVELPAGTEQEGRRSWLEDAAGPGDAGSIGRAIHQVNLRDGRWMQARVARTGNGASVAIIDDITELKRAQGAYLDLIAEEDMILDTLPVGVVFLERDAIVRCNRSLETMLGYAPGELTGKSVGILFHSEDVWDDVRQEAIRRLAVGPIVEGEVRLARRDGSAVWCRTNGRGSEVDGRLTGIFTYADVEARRSAEDAVRRSELMYRNLVETSNDLIWTMDAAQRWTYVNPAAAERTYGLPARAIIGRRFSELSVETARERDEAVMAGVLRGEAVHDYETRHRARDGSHVDIALNAVPLLDSIGRVTGVTGTARDITAHKRAAAQLHESVEKLRLAVEAADLVYWEWDCRSGGRGFEATLEAIAGPGASHGGNGWTIHPDDREEEAHARAAALRGESGYQVEFRILSEGGGVRWVASRGTALRDASGSAQRMIGVFQDITERKRGEEEARYMAYHDMLTGLPNRRLFDDRLRQAVYSAQRQDSKVAVLAIDLDHFKQVNDSLGHRAGDTVLRDVAGRLAGCVRRSDTLARHGGDEFVILAPDLKEETDAQSIAEKLLHALRPGFPAADRSFGIGASIGISIYPGDAQDSEALMRNADAAMYLAKEQGRNSFRFYGR